MKKASLLLLTVLLISIVTFDSCTKEDSIDPSTTPVIKANEINTTIDGTVWSGSILSWAVTGGTRQLNATSSNSSIQIFMPEDTTGTFNASDNVVTLSYNDGTTTWSNNISGQVTISTNSNDHVEGVFELVIGSYFNSATLDFTAGIFYFK